MTPAEVMLALLLVFPTSPARPCLVARQDTIRAALTEAAIWYPSVPSEVLAATAFLETHVGCDGGEDGGWGAPVSRRRRHTAGTHLNAAFILAVSLHECGGWRWTQSPEFFGPLMGARGWAPALRRFNTGLCAHSRSPNVSPAYAAYRARGDWYVRTVWNVVQRLRRAGTDLPTCKGGSS